MFHGSMVALVTPMHEDGRIDVERLRALVEFHLSHATDAIVAAGTTGEAGTLTHDEKLTVVRHVIEQVDQRCPVIAGSGANATHETSQLTQEVMALGADAALIMTPAYIKPSQQGLLEHYRYIANQSALPIILYNVPSRTACDLLPETVAQLATIPNIVGLKDATADIERLQALQERCEDRVDIYSGDDLTANEWIQAGARGVISVTANVIPQQMASMVHFASNNQKQEADALHAQYQRLHEVLFVESNPVPVKWAVHLLGRIEAGIRLPLMQASQTTKQSIQDVMQELKLL